MVVGTMLGKIEHRALTTGGLRTGDLVGMTRTAGLEGTSILLAEHGSRLRELPEVAAGIDDAATQASNLSVVAEALAAASCRGVSALHDVTEGGVGEALHELALASGLRVEAAREAVPVLPVTAAVCQALGLDPLGLIGSGSLLVGCSPEGSPELEQALAAIDVPLTWIGRAAAAPAPRSSLPRFQRDELLRAGVMAGIRGVVFDMDGTLVDSIYDWPAIRRELGVSGASIIDELNGLGEPERSRRWAELEAIEASASRAAELHEGAAELLELLAAHGLATALVTNNSDDNTGQLLERFGLSFDVVVTRDSGLWKPSGKPVAEAVRRLGLAPERCLGVGDSHYDVQAVREAGLAAICMLHDGHGRHGPEAELSFADIPAFMRYLKIVLG
jgi:HAD superfamily hydrolase (TIGR01509 family)